MDALTLGTSLLPDTVPWGERLAFIIETMREMSRIADPQQLVQSYAARMRQVMPIDGMVSLSRATCRFPAIESPAVPDGNKR